MFCNNNNNYYYYIFLNKSSMENYSRQARERTLPILYNMTNMAKLQDTKFSTEYNHFEVALLLQQLLESPY